MADRTDDLASLLAPAGEPDLGFRQGNVITFDPVSGQNTIDVGGAQLVDVPLLNMTGAALLLPGDAVGLLRVRSQYFILGRIVVPGQGQLGTRLSLAYAAEILPLQQLVTEDVWSDLATVGPTVPDVPIGAGGRAIVIVAASIQNANAGQGWMGFEIAGATSRAPNTIDACSARSHNLTNSLGAQFATVVLAENLAAGLHTFTAKYRTSNDPSSFTGRRLVVLPY